jgi:hypothetical protein
VRGMAVTERKIWLGAGLVAALLLPTAAANAGTDRVETATAALDPRFSYVAGAHGPATTLGASEHFDAYLGTGDDGDKHWTFDAHSLQDEPANISEQHALFVAENSSLTVLAPSEAEPISSELELLAASITCSLNVQNVHGSTHVAGTINGIASISCTRVAGSLQIHYSMIRLSPYAQWAGPSRTNGGHSSITTNRAIPCSEGRAAFRGWAQGIISPPPGYSLSGPASTNAYGNISYVECRNHTGPYGADPTSMEGSERIAVTFVRNDLLEEVGTLSGRQN